MFSHSTITCSTKRLPVATGISTGNLLLPFLASDWLKTGQKFDHSLKKKMKMMKTQIF